MNGFYRLDDGTVINLDYTMTWYIKYPEIKVYGYRSEHVREYPDHTTFEQEAKRLIIALGLAGEMKEFNLTAEVTQ